MSREPGVVAPHGGGAPGFDIAPNDPIVAFFLSTSGAVEVDKLQMDSPALKALKAADVKLAVPLVSQGELVGLLALGPRMSEQEYSSDDRGLLSTLATQAAPAVRVAQMIGEQQSAIRERERVDQELRVARLIQRTLLPQELPAFPGWQLAAHYQPAREVGGDFYDFISFDDGQLGIVIGDVTDKEVPAALVMATTRSILRSVAQSEDSPGNVLEKVNDLLHHDIPPKMFVTCLYAILDRNTGRLCYANAGHDLPYHRHDGKVFELRATGMPLGLMPGMHYEEKETFLLPGDSMLFYSDGIVEAHNSQRQMFGFPRLMALLREQDDSTSTIDYLLAELAAFTGPDLEQEDDVTLVTLQHTHGYGMIVHAFLANVDSTRQLKPSTPKMCYPYKTKRFYPVTNVAFVISVIKPPGKSSTFVSPTRSERSSSAILMVCVTVIAADIITAAWPCGSMAKTSTISPTKPKPLASRASLAPNEEQVASVRDVGIVISPRTEIGSAAPAVLSAIVTWSDPSICICLPMART